MGTRAAIYARQSMDRSGEEAAVSRQVDACTKLAEARDYELVDTYVDNDRSATKGPRPSFDRMVADLEAGRFDVVIAWATDRLGRRVVEISGFIDLARKNNVSISTVSGDLDLSTAHGRMVANLLGAVAQGEVEVKAARQAAAARQRAENGSVRWTRRPYGYDFIDGEYIVVEHEAKVLREAAEKVIDGATLSSVVRDLNERGVPTSTGKRWTVTGLKRLLVSQRHVGTATYHGQAVASGDWPAIFTAHQHDRLVRRLSDPTRRTAPADLSNKYLLSGLGRCGVCGEKMYASPMVGKGRRWMVYKCRRPHLARRLDLVDEVVDAVIVARLSRPDAAALLVPDVDLDALRAEADDLRRVRESQTTMHRERLITDDELRATLVQVRDRLDHIEATIDAATGNSGPVGDLVTAEDVAQTWQSMSLRNRREVIDMLMTVTVEKAPYKGARFSPEQVRIDWKATR